MFLSATGANTLMTVSLADTFVNNNGSNVFAGDGINGTVLAGARLNLEGSTTGLVPTSFNGNKGDGIDIFVSGVSSRADVDLHNVTVGTTGSGNTLNGFQFQSLDGGVHGEDHERQVGVEQTDDHRSARVEHADGLMDDPGRQQRLVLLHQARLSVRQDTAKVVFVEGGELHPDR